MSNQEDKDSLKTSFIYASMQIFTVAGSLIRNKVLAYFTGAVGMGLFALYNAPINFLSILVNFGLPFSAVYEITKAVQEDDGQRKYNVIKSLFFTLIAFSIFMILLLFIFSNKISNSYFKNEGWYAIFYVGLVVIFNVLTDAIKSILQALRLKKLLIKSSIFSLIITLVVSMPIVILYNYSGILPSIVIGSLTALLCMWFLSKSELGIYHKNIHKDITKTSKTLISAGFKYTLSQQIGALSKLILVGFLSKFGGMQVLGYYSIAASFTIGIFGTIIISLTTDYYPRMITAINNGLETAKPIIHEHLRVSLLIVLPMIIVFVNNVSFIVEVTLSRDFLVIVKFLQIAMLGVFFQIFNAPLGLVLLAAGKKNFNLLFEGLAMNFLFLGLSIIGYLYNGLEGMAVFYNIYQIIYSILIMYFLVHYFDLRINNSTLSQYAGFGILIFGIIVFSILKYNIMGIKISWAISILALFWCTYNLNKIYKLSSILSFFKSY